MAKIHKPTSPYYQTPIKDFYLDIWRKREIPAQSSDLLITIEPQHENRPDLLSADLYGTPRLWWVFAVRNMDVLVDPLKDFRPGTKIYAPTKDTIKDLI